MNQLLRLVVCVLLTSAVPNVQADTSDEWEATYSPTISQAVQNYFRTSRSTAASVAMMVNGKWVIQKNYGVATPKSMYDLASLTKTVGTAAGVLKIIDLGWGRIDEKVIDVLPEFAKCTWVQDRFPDLIKVHGWKDPLPPNPALCDKKKEITVELLMRHRSGLRDKVPPEVIKTARERDIDPIDLFLELPLMYEPGTEFFYADIQYIVLRKWAERKVKAHGYAWADFLRKEVYSPLQMKSTGYFSEHTIGGANFIPTQYNFPAGIVEDPIARGLGSASAGHAGLYSTLGDLQKFAEMWMDKGTLDDKTIYSAPLAEFATAYPTGIPLKEGRGLGWDLTSPISESAHGPIQGGFGHTGYTGTSIWIQPEDKIAVIVLTNRTYRSEGKITIEAVNQLRETVAGLVWKAKPTVPTTK